MSGQQGNYRDPQHAFRDAIASGRLSADPKASNYAGKYMYMGERADKRGDAFKNIITRQYID